MSDANTTEEIPPIQPRPRTEPPKRDSTRTWIAVGLIAIAGLVAIGWALTQPISMDEPSPGATTPEPSTPIAQGQVTAAAGLPQAEPLTDDAIAAMSDAWILAAFDGAAYGQGTGRLTGPTVLYGIDADGTAYEVVNMTELGADALMAWDPDRAMVLFRRDNQSSSALHAYDIATGALAPAIDPCAGYEQASPATAESVGDGWRLYSLCRDSANPDDTWAQSVFMHTTTVDDAGQLIPDRGVVAPPQGRFVTVVGDTHVTWGYPDEPEPADDGPSASPGADGAREPTGLTPDVIARRADGASILLDTPPGAYWCSVSGPGRGDTVALLCVDRAREGIIVAEAPLDGSQARTTTESFPGIGVNVVSTGLSCATDTVLALQIPAGPDFPAHLLASDGGQAEEVSLIHEPAQACYGSRDGRLLIGGVEGLGWYDPSDGVTRMLLTSPTPTMLGMNEDHWVQGVLTLDLPFLPLGVAGSQGVLLDGDA